MKLHAEAYLEYIYGTSSKFYSLALLEDVDGSWSCAFNYGKIGAPRGWGNKAANVPEAAARKAYDAALRDKSDYELRINPDGSAAIPEIARYQNVERVGNSSDGATSVVVPVTAGGTGIDRDQPADGGVPRFPAQLCAQHGSIAPALAAPDAYAVEEKLDGFRGGIAILPDGRFEIRNRDGISTGRIENTPRLVTALEALVAKRPELRLGTLFDGELVGKTWNETATLLSKSGGASSDSSLRYVVFDAPFLAGRDLRGLSFNLRRAELEKIGVDFDGSVISISALLTPEPDLAQRIWARGGEGLIVKDRNARYVPGDRRAWAKIKEFHTTEGVILGYDAGKIGKYSDTTGAVRIGMIKNGVLAFICSVSGMSDEVRRSLDDSSIGRVVEISYQSRTKTSLRHPQWEHFRDDKAAADCRWEDLV